MKKFIRLLFVILPLSSSILFYSQVSNVFADDIIDNGDPGTSFTGTWYVSGGSNPWNPTDPGAISLYSQNGTTYTWTFTPATSGNYDLSMWWTSYSTRNASIPVDIEHWGGADRIYINQQQNGGQWNLLDTYAFEADVSYNITITSQPGSSTSADAVQFIFRPVLNITPVAVIDSITPNPALTDGQITFTGHGDDLNGSIIGYSWDSSIDGHLSDLASFTTVAPLSTGTHSISFTVYDNDGKPSETVSQTLVVQDTLTEWIIDNGDPGTSFTGTWYVSGGSNPWNPTDPGAISLYSQNGTTYTWTFTPATSGNYDLSMWWTSYSTRNASIPVDIEHWGGADRIYINQQQNGGQWNLLDTYAFEADVSYNITITSQPGSSTSADAVQFIFRPVLNITPVAVIDSITPNPALTDGQITFTGHGDDLNGSIIGYSWDSSIDGHLSDLESFTTVAPLSTGTHSISFTVYDNDGKPSETVSQTLVVQDTLTEWIIDNGDPGTSFTGTWYVSGGSNPWNPTDPGAISLYSQNGTTYTWTFTPATSGNYDLSMWWTSYSTRNASIPVDIEHWGGADRIYINQQQNGGQWNLLDTYAFEADVSYNITITSQPGSSTSADAVQFIFRPVLNITPVAVIDSITPNPALTDGQITFTGHGDDLDGSIIGYSWDSSIDGHLSDLASFTTVAPLSTGTHSISFTVYDNDGKPSETVSQTLVVQDTLTEWIIDNGDPGTSFTGTWYVSGGSNPWNPTDPGAISLYSQNGTTYTWTFTPATSGNYDLSMWWTSYSTRNASIPVDIEHWGGADRIYINQQQNGGQWNLLDTYAFEADVSYNITITSQPGSSTSADAVKIVYTGGVINFPPVVTIDVITSPAVLPGDVVTFMGSGNDIDGSVTAYEWESDIDGLLSNQAMFSTILSPGIHTIFFRVQDDQGAWSSYTTALVVVRNCDSPVAIMPLGDSITLGFGETSLFDLMSGYRAPLHQQLIANGYYIDFVGNRTDGLHVSPSFDINHQGIAGITAASVANNIYNWLADNPSEIILLHIGTNAFSTNISDVDTILDEIDRFEAVSGLSIAVILARIINRQPFHPETTVFNDNVQAMAELRMAAGDKLVIVDQELALDYATDMSDSLHPNNSGYAKMAGPWMDELLKLLPICSMFKPFIYTTPGESVMIGSEYAYQVRTIGNPAPTYNLLVGPTGMTLDEMTGEIDWMPTAEQQGTHSITIQATSPVGVDQQSFTINVTNEIVIINNGDTDTFSTGDWRVSGGANPYDPDDLLATSVYSRDGSTYTWTFTPTTSGSYQLFMWWTQYASRSNSIPVYIEYEGGTDSLPINQQINGGMWNSLGIYSFVAGVSYYITIISPPGPATTCADAVRFVKN